MWPGGLGVGPCPVSASCWPCNARQSLKGKRDVACCWHPKAQRSTYWGQSQGCYSERCWAAVLGMCCPMRIECMERRGQVAGPGGRKTL